MHSEPHPNSKHLIDLMAEQVAGQVEALTRFGRETLALKDGKTRVSKGKVTWQFSPRIFIEQEHNRGKAGYHDHRLDSFDQLTQMASSVRDQGVDNLRNRFTSWLTKNGGNDSELTASDCFNGPVSMVYEYRCRNCGGHGWVQCTPCKGAGSNKCGNCDAKGQLNCPKCRHMLWGNTGKQKCGNCRGSGTDPSTKRKCAPCRGKGKVTCSRCGGAKAIRCEKCAGSGQIVCRNCKGTGKLDCHACDATGFLHEVRIVKCEVSSHYDYTSLTRPETSVVVAELSNRDLNQLRQLAAVTQLEPTVNPQSLIRNYEATCLISEMTLQAGEETRDFIGFGSNAVIFDFQNILPVLLEADLVHLEKTVQDTPWSLHQQPEPLLIATRQLLQSEINSRIDEAQFVASKTVTSSYVNRVQSALKGSLELLMIGRLGLPALYTLVTFLLSFTACFASPVREFINGWHWLPPLLLPAGTWLLLEYFAVQRLSEDLNEASDTDIPLSKLLNNYQTRLQPRLVVGGFLIASLIAALIWWPDDFIIF